MDGGEDGRSKKTRSAISTEGAGTHFIGLRTWLSGSAKRCDDSGHQAESHLFFQTHVQGMKRRQLPPLLTTRVFTKSSPYDCTSRNDLRV